ncbi:MAG: GAF domain-containing protein [Anaerolineales bacterium]|nr:GAF domain-containing protein [Anaerolineales bacterium]
MGPWYVEASRFGLASGISLPLISEAQPFGVLNIYAAESDAFDAGEVKLLTELATNLAYGIAALRTRVAQQWAEQAFRESEARFRTIITEQSDGIVIVDNVGVIRFVNPAAEALLGFPASALVGELLGFPIVTSGAAAEVNIYRRGHILIVEMRVVEIDWAGDTASLISFHDVTERKEAEEALRLREMGLNSLLELSQKAPELSEREIIQLAVEETVKLTQSAIGYLHFVNPDQQTIQLYTWSQHTLDICTAVHDAHYPLDYAGVWADCARLKQPVIHNDYQNLPHKKGYPPGHVHLIRHLSVPIVDEDKVVVILGVGNKEFDYYESDVRQMLLTADHLWKVIRRKRAEAELQKYQNHLEDLVTGRTTKLIQANERLRQEVLERQQAEAALRESEERFRLVADFTYDWELWTGTDGDLIYVSPACERMSGYGPAEFHQNSGLMQAIVHPDDQGYVARHFQEELSSPKVISSEWRIIRRDGQERWIGHICQPVYSTDGRYLGRRASNRDITERRGMEGQLQEYTTHLEHLVSEKVHELELERAKTIQAAKMVALGEMATGVAHELNQPLTAMLFEAEYLKTMCRQVAELPATFSIDMDEVYHTAESLEQDIARCRRIIDHLRAFGRIYAEHVSRVSLNQSIEQSFILVGERLKNHGIALDLSLDPQLPLIMADTHKLEQVFLNLISNAEYALNQMEQRVQHGLVELATYHKTLEISTRAEDCEVIAVVRDNGCGIPAADQEHLFEPFFTTKPIGQGTGLGLPISYSLVKEFKGEILFHSVENVGTTFTLRFPAAAEA